MLYIKGYVRSYERSENQGAQHLRHTETRFLVRPSVCVLGADVFLEYFTTTDFDTTNRGLLNLFRHAHYEICDNDNTPDLLMLRLEISQNLGERR